MSYTVQHKFGAQALGGTWDDALSAVKQMSGAIDPYLPEALCRVDQIRALRKDRTVWQAVFGKQPTVQVPVCYNTPANIPGIGVESAMLPLRAGVYLNENPLTVWAGVVAVLLIPMMIGYSIGSSK